MWNVRAGGSPFAVLLSTFFAQFFTSESVTSEDDLRRMITGVVAFLLPPVLFLMVETFPNYQIVVLVATTRHLPHLVDDMLAWLAFVMVTYSMVTVGFIAVCVWDALSFSWRDAMVLGPLPLRGVTIVAAKLAALSAFLLGASTAVNLLNTLAFATTTANSYTAGLLRHFMGPMIATVAAATFVFAVVVVLRGVLTFVGSAGFAALCGSILQFVFVIALLSFVILVAQSGTARPAFLESSAAWNPAIWFAGLFEWLRGSRSLEWIPLAQRALWATLVAILIAAIMSVIGFRRQMRLGLAPQTRTNPGGTARISRILARAIGGGHPIASATSDFILLTIARNRPQQGPIAINAAIGAAIVVAGLSRSARDPASFMVPRVAVLWIPLVIAYWTAIGMRVSFFVASELPAAWSFRVNAPESTHAYWSAVRASMIAVMVPAMIALTFLVLVPLLGWRIAAWHALVVSVLVIVLVEVIALTIHFVPFTRAYPPGHANLKTRWPIYALGLYVFAYWPTRLELWLLDSPASLLSMVLCVAATIPVLEIVGRRRARRWSVHATTETTADRWDETLLDIGRVVRSKP
jgi:hypothetical protein